MVNASPQRENGNTSIANEVLEHLCLVNLSPYEMNVFLVIVRETWGYHNAEHRNSKITRITYPFFEDVLRLPKSNIRRAIVGLLQKKMIIVEKDENGCLVYGPQKDWTLWPTRSVISRDNQQSVIGGDNSKGISVISRDNSRLSPEITPSYKRKLKKSLKKDVPSIPYEEIIAILNQRTGKNFRFATPKYQACIRARWNEGFRVGHFKAVVDNRVEKWGDDPKMSEYLRPETLFGNKFQGYLNDNGSKPQIELRATPKEEIDGLYE